MRGESSGGQAAGTSERQDRDTGDESAVKKRGEAEHELRQHPPAKPNVAAKLVQVPESKVVFWGFIVYKISLIDEKHTTYISTNRLYY